MCKILLMLLRSCYQLDGADSRWRSPTRSVTGSSHALATERVEGACSSQAAGGTRLRGGRAAAAAARVGRRKDRVEEKRQIIFAAVVFSVGSRSRRRFQIDGIKCNIRGALGTAGAASFVSSTSCRPFFGRPADGGRCVNAKPEKDTWRVVDNTVTRTAAGFFFRFGLIGDPKSRREGGRIRVVRIIIKQQYWYHPSGGEVPSGWRLPAVAREGYRAERTARREQPGLLASRVDVAGYMGVHGGEWKEHWRALVCRFRTCRRTCRNQAATRAPFSPAPGFQKTRKKICSDEKGGSHYCTTSLRGNFFLFYLPR